jgi:hypothetical protein
VDQLQTLNALSPGVQLVDFMGLGDCGPSMSREASPPMKRENPTPGLDFSGLSTHEAQMTLCRLLKIAGLQSLILKAFP